MPRGEGSFPMNEKGRAGSGKKSCRKKKSGNRKGQLEKGGPRAEVSPRNGRVGKWNGFGLEVGWIVTVFDKGKA